MLLPERFYNGRYGKMIQNIKDIHLSYLPFRNIGLRSKTEDKV
eukprot:SAG31_NODE_14765_length_788_cov_2.031930_1_plen_42_part_10